MIKNLVCFAAVVLLYACNGKNSDQLSVNSKGLTVEKVYMTGPGDIAIQTNKVAFNSRMAIVAQNIRNYTLKNNKAHPGLILSVTDSDGKLVFDEVDLLTDNGYTPANAAVLKGTIIVGEPMKPNEIYHVKMRIWDKNKVENEIIIETDLIVQ